MVVLVVVPVLNVGTYFWRMWKDGRETLRFDTYFTSQAGRRLVAESAASVAPGVTFYVPRAAIDRDVFPAFVEYR